MLTSPCQGRWVRWGETEHPLVAQRVVAAVRRLRGQFGHDDSSIDFSWWASLGTGAMARYSWAKRWAYSSSSEAHAFGVGDWTMRPA